MPSETSVRVELRSEADTSILDALGMHFARGRRLGYGPSGRFCLDCGEPLFTPELLHAPPDPEDLDVTDAIRWASSSYNRERAE